MPFTPRAKAIAFASGLLVVSTILVGSSIATTGSVLKPFANGQSFATERSMTRGQHVAIAVGVGQMVDDRIQPVEGALVALVRPGNASLDSAATGTTNDRGIVVFEIKPGAYEITVSKGELLATKQLAVPRDTRVAVFFDENGQAQWGARDHDEIEKGGRDEVGLAVRVMHNESGHPAAAGNATVRVYRVDGDGHRDLVREATTGPRGLAGFELRPGAYIVNVTMGLVSAEHGVPLRHSAAVGVYFDGAHAEWRAAAGQPSQKEGPHGQDGPSGGHGGPPASKGGRPSEKPTRSSEPDEDGP